MIIEKIKSDSYNHKSTNYYFWRTYEQQEIDFIIEAGGGLQAIEIKWNSTKQQKAPSIWTKTYPEANYQVINPENFRDLLS